MMMMMMMTTIMMVDDDNDNDNDDDDDNNGDDDEDDNDDEDAITITTIRCLLDVILICIPIVLQRTCQSCLLIDDQRLNTEQIQRMILMLNAQYLIRSVFPLFSLI